MIHHTYCDFHLGDNLVHLHFLRKCAIAYPNDTFFHYVQPCHIEQLYDAIEDLINIVLKPLEERPVYAIDAWKNAGAGTQGGGFFERSPHKNSFVTFHVAWFGDLCEKMGLLSRLIIREESDLLFDYPALRKNVITRLPMSLREGPTPKILFVNSQPCSGQCMAYDSVNYFDPLIADLAERNRVIVTQKTDVPNVPCTVETEMSVSEIGALSLVCDWIVGVATGPLWPTLNIWNQWKPKIVMLGNGEFLNFGGRLTQVVNRDEMRGELIKGGLL